MFEINQIKDFKQLSKLEKVFQNYKKLTATHRKAIPRVLLENIPYIAGDIQIARVYKQPKLTSVYYRSAYKKLKSDIETLHQTTTAIC